MRAGSRATGGSPAPGEAAAAELEASPAGAPWWLAALACPRCRSPLAAPLEGEAPCGQCGQSFAVEGNVARWPSAAAATARPRWDRARWARFLRYRLDPLASPHSPLVWLNRRRLEAYYRQALAGSALAAAWAGRELRDVSLPPRARVLDHGCGRGRVSAFLVRLGHEVAGQDVAAHPWWSRVKDGGFAVVPEGFDALPWQEETFDLIIDSMVIGHFSVEQLGRHAANVLSALKHGGSWVIVEANSTGLGVHTTRRHYGRLHSLERVRRLAAETGFREGPVLYHGVESPVFPRLFSYARTHLDPRGFDLGERESWLERWLPPHRRAKWRIAFLRS